MKFHSGSYQASVSHLRVGLFNVDIRSMDRVHRAFGIVAAAASWKYRRRENSGSFVCPARKVHLLSLAVDPGGVTFFSTLLPSLRIVVDPDTIFHLTKMFHNHW